VVQEEDLTVDNTVYCYTAEWDIYALSFSNNANYPFRIAMGSIKDSTDKNNVRYGLVR